MVKTMGKVSVYLVTYPMKYELFMFLNVVTIQPLQAKEEPYNTFLFQRQSRSCIRTWPPRRHVCIYQCACEYVRELFCKYASIALCRYSMGIRQKLAAEFGSTANKQGNLGRQHAADVTVTYLRTEKYYEELASSVFCGVLPGDGWSGRMEDSMLQGCIPVIIQVYTIIFLVCCVLYQGTM